MRSLLPFASVTIWQFAEAAHVPFANQTPDGSVIRANFRASPTRQHLGIQRDDRMKKSYSLL